MSVSGQEQHISVEKWNTPTREAYAAAAAQRADVLARGWDIAYILPTTVPESREQQPANYTYGTGGDNSYNTVSAEPPRSATSPTPPSVEGLQHMTGITAQDERTIDERGDTLARGLGTVTVESDQEVVPPLAQNVGMEAMADSVRASFDRIYGEAEPYESA